jgi:hypothetical protein
VPRGLLYRVMVPACSACDLKVVLMNLSPCTRCGDSHAGLEAVSRVFLPAPASGRRSYTDFRV